MEPEDRTLLETAAGKERSEDSSYFDDLATGLADGSISRRRALKWIGAGAVAFAIAPLFPEQAEAHRNRQRRRCRRRGGTPVERGECHCGYQCGSDVAGCDENPDCTCFKTIENRGFCGVHGFCVPCTASSECQPGWRCVVDTCCGEPTCLPPCTEENVAAAAASHPIGPTSDGT
jgi:hypothetical protein